MLFDLDIKSCSRSCAATNKNLEPGESYFSVLELCDTEMVRHDYSIDSWTGPPEKCLGWWRSRVPDKEEKPQLAPIDVMLNLFAALAEKPSESKFRYLLGLLLIRRRILRVEDTQTDDAGKVVMSLYSTRRDENHELLVDEPDDAQADQIQQRMIELLYGDTDNSGSTQADQAA